MIEFCECGGMLMPAGKDVVKCRSCGKELLGRMDLKMTTKATRQEMVVVDDNAPDLPVTPKKCVKCGNTQAFWWLIQTRSADEPPTQFFKCTNQKCNHTWREYK